MLIPKTFFETSDIVRHGGANSRHSLLNGFQMLLHLSERPVSVTGNICQETWYLLYVSQLLLSRTWFCWCLAVPTSWGLCQILHMTSFTQHGWVGLPNFAWALATWYHTSFPDWPNSDVVVACCLYNDSINIISLVMAVSHPTLVLDMCLSAATFLGAFISCCWNLICLPDTGFLIRTKWFFTSSESTGRIALVVQVIQNCTKWLYHTSPWGWQLELLGSRHYSTGHTEVY